MDDPDRIIFPDDDIYKQHLNNTNRDEDQSDGGFVFPDEINKFEDLNINNSESNNDDIDIRYNENGPQTDTDYENILVTGFGPFGQHKINASWEGVKLLDGKIIHDTYRIVARKIPVAYEYIDEHVPKMWDDLKPVLVIHVGVSHLTDKFTLETVANRSGYNQKDSEGRIKIISHCSKDSVDCIEPNINVHEINEEFNKDSNLQSCVSDNAGRYLCEYIYYKSLSIDNTRTLFVHVPMLNQPYCANELANGISKLIDLCLNHVPKEYVR